MEAIIIYLALFFMGKDVELPNILFWLILSCLALNTLISIFGSFGNKWRWKVLYGIEVSALVWANITAKWGIELESFYYQRDILLARVGAHLYLLLLLITIVVRLCFCLVRKAKERPAPKR